MKKNIAVVLTAVLALACVGCVGQKQEPAQMEPQPAADQTVPLAGGWGQSIDPQIPLELAEKCRKALEETEGMEYTPVALMETQVVAGINYRILLRAAAVTSDAAETYAFGTFYEDLAGNVTLSRVLTTEAETKLNNAPGGWIQPESVALTQEAKAAFDAAMAPVDMDYQPVALVSTQVVAGTNYGILCRTSMGYPDGYALAYISEDLQGHAQILEIIPLK